MTETLSNSPSAKDLHPALIELIDAFRPQEDGLQGDTNWVAFSTSSAFISADVKDDGKRISIRAFLLLTEDEDPSEQEVEDWIDRQSKVLPPRQLRLTSYEAADGVVVNQPRLRFEFAIGELEPRSLHLFINYIAEQWRRRGDLSLAEMPILPRSGDADITGTSPQNAWLLMADIAAWPDDGEIENARQDGVLGIFDTLWTAPKNGEVGDLVLIYFVAPRKAAHFAARIASRPFWEDEIEVNANVEVKDQQWWAHLTPLIPIEPIPFAELQGAQDGHLNLRGRSGHYLNPATIKALTFTAIDPERQTELDSVVQNPAGDGRLPDPDTTTFEEWKRIPSGLLPLEAKVSEHIVGPLARFLDRPSPHFAVLPDLVLSPQFRLKSGIADFVLTGAGEPLAAIEVKLAIRRSLSGGWAGARDFAQLQRYIGELGVPGLLIDAHSILLVRAGDAEPYREFVRADATPDDIDEIRQELFGAAHEIFGGTGGIPPKRALRDETES